MRTELLVLYSVEDNLSFKLEEFAKHSRKHSELLQLWWNDKTGENHSDDVASDHGFMVWNDDRPIAAIFLHPVYGCKMALIGTPIANPLVFKEERRAALDFLVAGVEEKAKSLHYDYLMTYAGSNGAKEMFSRIGYVKGDENVINYCKKI